MKVKLTVLVDEKLAAHVRSKARREKRTLSSVIEQGLENSDISKPSPTHHMEAWVGKFSLPQRDPKDPRLNALIDHYEQADYR